MARDRKATKSAPASGAEKTASRTGGMVIERVPLSSVFPDPANARSHDARNLDAIRGSLARFGQQKPIVIDHSGVIRAGNGTYEAAKALGWTSIDVVRTDLAGLEAVACRHSCSRMRCVRSRC